MAAIDRQARELPRNFWIAALFGAYACLIAVSPSPLTGLVLAAPLVVIPLMAWIVQTANRWLWCFFFAALLLPPLPFAFGNSGPHVSLAIASIGVLCGALRLPQWRVCRNVLTFAFTVFFLWLLFSSGLAVFYSGLAIASSSFIRVLLFGIPVYVFFYTAYGPSPGNPPDDARRLYWLGVLSAAIACLDFYFQFPAPAGYGPQFIWLDSGVYRRAQGVFYEASTLGNLCAFFLVMVAVTLLRRPPAGALSSAAVWLGSPVLFTALILSYSRGSLLNLSAAMLTLLYLERKRLKIRRLFAVVASGLVASALGASLLFPTSPGATG